MERRDFIKYMALSPLFFKFNKMNALNYLSTLPDKDEIMPVLFVGHGNPMNAIEENEFVKGFREIAESIEKPEAVLCISAHWETKGTFVTAMKKPPTIHDFGGFPQELFDVQYPAPGNPELAKDIKNIISKTKVGLDENWGLDHGAWSVIKHFYPNADVPVLELSIDYTKDANYHYELAKQLAPLRKKGVLIMGSGNVIHNLRLVAWNKINEDNFAYDWAIEANELIKSSVLAEDISTLINYKKNGKAFNLAIPTPEHYLPLLYSLALKDKNEEISIFNDKYVAGSLSMTSFKIS